MPVAPEAVVGGQLATGTRSIRSVQVAIVLAADPPGRVPVAVAGYFSGQTTLSRLVPSPDDVMCLKGTYVHICGHQQALPSQATPDRHRKGTRCFP